MIASVETDVFTLDLAPAAKLGRDSLFLSPGIKNPAKKLTAPKFRGQQGDKDENGKKDKTFIYNKLLNSHISCIGK